LGDEGCPTLMKDNQPVGSVAPDATDPQGHVVSCTFGGAPEKAHQYASLSHRNFSMSGSFAIAETLVANGADRHTSRANLGWRER
jgi:hypothetical protein